MEEGGKWRRGDPEAEPEPVPTCLMYCTYVERRIFELPTLMPHGGLGRIGGRIFLNTDQVPSSLSNLTTRIRSFGEYGTADTDYQREVK